MSRHGVKSSMNFRGILLFVCCIVTIQGQSQSLDTLKGKWAISGEIYGTSLAIAGYGEYMIPRKKVTFNARVGIGRSSFYWEEGEGITENLCFPHVVTITLNPKVASRFHLEVGAGGSLDLFETGGNTNLWVNNSPQEKHTIAFYRAIPFYLGIRQINAYGYLFRYYLTVNKAHGNFVFPMIGLSFGGLIE